MNFRLFLMMCSFTTQCPDLWSPLLQLVPLFEQKVSIGRCAIVLLSGLCILVLTLLCFFTDSGIRSWLHVPSIRLLEEESHKGFGDSWLIRKKEELSSRRAVRSAVSQLPHNTRNLYYSQNARTLEQWAKERAADRSSELEAVRRERFKECA